MKCLGYVFLVAALFAVGCGFLALELTHDAVLSVVIAILALAAASLALIQAAVKLAEYVKIASVVLLALSSGVRAEELQFDLTGTANTPDDPFFPGVGPFDISFMLDTQSGTSNFLYGNFQTPGGVSCLQHFDVSGGQMTNINMNLNGQTLFSGDSALTNYGGDNAGGGCPGFFFAALLFDTPRVNGWWEFDPSPGAFDLSKSPDPIASLFLGFQQYPSLASISLDGAQYNLSFKSVSVTSVPEPGPLALLLLGLVALKMTRLCRTRV